jgi:hypothetical protein
MPGNAFVAGSESGFVYSETMRKVLKNHRYLDNYNGKKFQGHTSNGEKFHKAQVFVTKFKDNNNEPIDLFEGLI